MALCIVPAAFTHARDSCSATSRVLRAFSPRCTGLLHIWSSRLNYRSQLDFSGVVHTVCSISAGTGRSVRLESGATCPYCGYHVTDIPIDTTRDSFIVRCPNCGGTFEYIVGFGAFAPAGGTGQPPSQPSGFAEGPTPTYEPRYVSGPEQEPQPYVPPTPKEEEGRGSKCKCCCTCLICIWIIQLIVVLLMWGLSH